MGAIKKVCFAICFLFSIRSVIAQSPLVDSLLALTKKEGLADSVKIKLYGDISWELIGSDINAAQKYAAMELELSVKTSRKADIAQSESDLGSIYNRKAIYDTALIHYYKALKLRQELKQEVKEAGIYTNIATVFMRQNKFSEALDINFKTLKIFEKVGDDVKQAITLGNIANLYYELEQNGPALQFMHKSIELARKANHQITVANVLVNIGGIKFEEGVVKDVLVNKVALDTALLCFKEAESIFESLHAAYNLGVVYNNIGRIYTIHKNYKEALDYYRKGLSNRIILEDGYGIGLSNLNLGEVEYLSARYDKAIVHLDSAATVFLNLKNYINLKQAYGKLAECYEAKNELPKALKYYQLYNNYKDSVYTIDNAEKMAEMQTRYQTEKKDLEIAKQKAELEVTEQKVNSRNNLILFTILIALLLLASLYFFFRKRQVQAKAERDAELAHQKDIRAKAIIEAEEKERVRIAKDLHDGVGQLLSAAKMNLSSIQDKIKITSDEDNVIFKNALELVDESVKEVRTVSHNMMPNTLLKMGLASAVKEFITKIQNTPNLKVNLEIVGLTNRLEQEKESVLYRVIQELVSNIIKHAKASELTLQLIKHDAELTIMIEDNGVGFDTSKISTFEGIGLKNIMSRVEFINGTVHFDSEPGKGTRVILDIPA
ncbi:MAG: sensor histidine kinase [Bacteroidia bacterium]|nr:sensor histidine kinase [Bacteroidia bacterium]